MSDLAQVEATAGRATGASKVIAVAVPVFVAVYLFVSLGKAAHAPAWVDEVFTRWMVERVPARELLEAIVSGADCQPPTYYLLLKGVCRVFGDLGYFPLRVPSVFGFLVFQLSIFWLLRRRFPLHVAALGMMLPCLTEAGDCAIWARPYALLAGCFGLAVVFWDGKGALRWRLTGMWLALAGAMLLHFYAVLLIAMMGAMEMLWCWRHRRARPAHLIVLLLASGPALLWLPLLAPLHRIGASYSAGPRFFGAPTPWAAFSEFLNLVWTPPTLIIASAILLTALFFRERKEWKPASILDLDIVAAGCLLLPLLTFVFAKFVTHFLNERYFFESAMIAGLGAALLLNRLPIPRRAAAALVGLAMLAFVFTLLAPADPRAAVLSEAKQQLPILVANGSDFFELVESTPKALRDRLVFMATPNGVIPPDPSAERIAAAWKRWYPTLSFVQPEEFLRENQRFYLLSTDKVEGITHWILDHNALSVVEYSGSAALFLSTVSAYNGDDSSSANSKYTTGSANRLLSTRSSIPP